MILTDAPSATRPARPAPVPRAASRTAVLAASAAGFALAFVAAYLLFVRTEAGRGVENGVVRSAQSAGTTVDWAAPLREADLVVVLGGVAVLIVAISVVRRRLALGVMTLVLLAAPLVVAQLLKLYVLDRPGTGDRLGVAGHNSFPSGHASAAMAVLVALAIVLPRRFRRAALVTGGFGVAWVSAAAVALGWHRLSDTVGGGLLVAAVTCAGAAVVSARRPDGDRVPLVPVLTGFLAPPALVPAGYAVLATATSGAAQFVAALVLAALSSMAVVLLLAGPLRRVAFDPAESRVRRLRRHPVPRTHP
ncbi:phosphoesterase, PA-phosphatase related protein [Amycolatopsis mediterranei S699]|uniref:Phosphoesterase, PA-phosphatase related protein n=1 Tax=Amycolatopsis mediterranei (strain U-32) TaxID=749927 RepID=A0A0H3D5K5_AMYMU|nr:phosphoesterase, PA-phosphatase related protein [Amycolatopsis mediterranei U32]AFO76519.1 phosphoesterase, PA-phosphatase related protein [Amycolatopsis mediterranei S699]AGT83648.1 phosphoesterase, PA-phosphatase related protein [Amycolatopsis mediterranei RB]